MPILIPENFFLLFSAYLRVTKIKCCQEKSCWILTFLEETSREDALCKLCFEMQLYCWRKSWLTNTRHTSRNFWWRGEKLRVNNIHIRGTYINPLNIISRRGYFIDGIYRCAWIVFSSKVRMFCPGVNNAIGSRSYRITTYKLCHLKFSETAIEASRRITGFCCCEERFLDKYVSEKCSLHCSIWKTLDKIEITYPSFSWSKIFLCCSARNFFYKHIIYSYLIGRKTCCVGRKNGRKPLWYCISCICSIVKSEFSVLSESHVFFTGPSPYQSFPK